MSRKSKAERHLEEMQKTISDIIYGQPDVPAPSLNGLPQQLREWSEGDVYLAPMETKKMLDAAADRIEQLEAALREICDGPRDADKSYAELFAEVCIEARSALAGEKKDD